MSITVINGISFLNSKNVERERKYEKVPHLTPALPVSDLSFVLEVSHQGVASRELPGEPASVGCGHHGGHRHHHLCPVLHAADRQADR